MRKRKSIAIACLALMAALLSCGSATSHVDTVRPDSSQIKTTTMMQPSDTEEPVETSDCAQAEQLIVQRDFRKWQGLPDGCDWTKWTGSLPTDWQEVMRGPLGSSSRNGYQLFFELEGYEHPSMSYADGKAILFEARAPQIVAFDSLLAALGKPSAKLDWDFGTLPLPKCEYVYPHLGITLFMNTDADRALHIALYASTTLADYESNLRPKFKKTRKR